MIKNLFISSVTRFRFFNIANTSLFDFSYLALSMSSLSSCYAPRLSSSVRGLLLFSVSLLQILRGRRFLFFLVGAGFLLIVLTACSGGDGADSSSNTDISIRELDCSAVTDEDCDDDGHNDDVDIDDDGDGLIEIRTAEELDSVRYALRGNGQRSSADAALDTTGCGNGDTITFCSGYELDANISLATYANADSGKGWQPLGHDNDSSTEGCQGAAFSGVFEGNGFRISNLTINRPNEDCVGLFGHTVEHSELEIFRNINLYAETIVGDDNVGSLVGYMVNATISSSFISIGNISGKTNLGGLVGFGQGAEILSSSVEAGEVIGSSDDIGGLVGFGEESRVYSSSVVAAEVSGKQNLGGLAGHGANARVYSSSVVVGEVSGTGDAVGGLVGTGGSSGAGIEIHSSSVVVGEVSGSSSVGGLVGTGEGILVYSSLAVAAEVSGSINIGGLVGYGALAEIHSSLVVVGNLSGNNNVGGLAGVFDSGKVAYSYVVSGSNTSMLGGQGSGDGVASYWDSDTSGVNNGSFGEAKTSNELRSPTRYEGIYNDWDSHTNIFNDGNDEPLAVWCDKDNSGSIEADERTPANRVWDFGSSSQYPAIRCTPLAPDDWRDWWSLDGTTGKPKLDQTLP